MADSVCGVAFSIWLRPSGATAERLAEVIAQVADQFQAPNFPPHVTLLGNAPKGVSIEEAKEMTEKLAKSIMPLELKVLPEIAFQNTWNQNVLMYVEESEALQSANSLAREILLKQHADGHDGHRVPPAFAAPSRRPHLSLIYGDHPQEERSKIVSWIKDKAPWLNEGLSFEVEELELWAASPGFSVESVPSWYLVDRFKLQPKS